MGKENNTMKVFIIVALILILIFPFSAYVQNAMAGSLEVNVGDMAFTKKVKTFKDMKFENVIRQTKDYSCGAAATATILTYYFGIKTSEDEVMANILGKADSEKREKVMHKGFSLLDLKRYGEHLGFKAGGYRVPDHLLNILDRPAIALINNNGYSHFIVVKGVMNDKVFIADPAKGNTVWDIGKFSKMWSGVLLVFEKQNGEEIKSHPLSAKSVMDKNKLFFIARGELVRFAISPSEF